MMKNVFLISALLIFYFSQLALADELICLNDENDLIDTSDYRIQLTSTDNDPKNCTYRTTQTISYRTPTITISKASLTGKNQVIIWQWTNLGGRQVAIILNSSNYQDQQIQLLPMPYHLDFEIPDNTDKDFFEIQVTYTNSTPSTAYINQMPSSLTVIVNSGDFPVGELASLNIGFTHLMISNNSFDVNLLKKFHAFSGIWSPYFVGTLYDIYQAGLRGQALYTYALGILNLNTAPVQGFSLLAHYQVPEYPVFSQSLIGTYETQPSPGNPKIVYEVNQDEDLLVQTSYQNLSVSGPGYLIIYAGCDSNPYQVIAKITAQNYRNYGDFSIYGRCRTYLVNDVKVQWQKIALKNPPVQPTRKGEQGIFMSYNFPYTESYNSKSIIKTITNPYDGAKFIVDYRLIDSSHKILVEADGKINEIRVNGQVESYSEQVLSGSDSFLVQYTVRDTSGTLTIYLVFLIICVWIY